MSILMSNFSGFLVFAYANWMLLFLAIIILALVEQWFQVKRVTPLYDGIRTFILKAMEEKFFMVTFNIIIDEHCTLIVRPINFDVQKIEFDEFDYFDFINYYNPDDDDFYKGNKIFDMDPFERDFKADFVAQQGILSAKKGKEFKDSNKNLKIAN